MGETWTIHLSKDLGFGHDPDEYTVHAPSLPEGEDFIHHLGKVQADRIIADHAAAQRVEVLEQALEGIATMPGFGHTFVARIARAALDSDQRRNSVQEGSKDA